ncbi:hypothetical protein PPL_05870 [Heterostelium album PN500]|uniref:Uncharacterized protein n=1 Tax=Heterostelium pallidum (strain ATCC 26659 / Pp 5 / PN500) TaxID=670386 RepID=D3BBK2_HETP5|nr:hypothetical protein PPL_05870 [Heterostelium album PN500]EFA81035.1 hypothetical protein PPL_05870 [Heterostelium album PN500]|eukprot:XP_020433153.1 hypothetical protein PPL_05870 [Heterostelium album PN500]
MIHKLFLTICIIVNLIFFVQSQCTADDIKNIVNVHNTIRNDAGITFGPKPLQPLPQLTWSNTIAQKLQSFVSSCQYNTVPGPNFSNYGYASFRIGGKFDPIRLVWGSTTEIGCGKMSCDSITWLLCGYSPSGGIVGMNPYPSIYDNPSQPTNTPQPTSRPSNTPRPTNTPQPTNTPNPTPSKSTPPSQSGLIDGVLSLVNGILDWRTINGVVTSIKDQGQCGGCWSFTSAASLESNYLINNTGSSSDLDLSEQYFIDCTYGRDGCNGGNAGDVFRKFQQSGAIMNSDDPYSGRYTGRCQFNTPTIKWTGFKTVQPNKQAFLDELKYGPIAVSLYADQGFMNYRNVIIGLLKTHGHRIGASQVL